MPIIEGIVSGTISGLIVAGALQLIGNARQDAFTFTYVGDGRVVLEYRRSRPIVIGGSFALEEGTVLMTADGFRAGTSGIVVEPRSQTVFFVGRLQPGHGFDFTYRPVPRLKEKKLRQSGRLLRWECDVMEFYNGNKPPPKGWKLESRVIMPSH